MRSDVIKPVFRESRKGESAAAEMSSVVSELREDGDVTPIEPDVFSR